MKEFSSFERVVGNIPETEKEKILQEEGERFDDQIFEELKGKERKKTSEELQIISIVNEATNEIRQSYGMENFDIPPKNVHIIAEEAWPMEKSVAFYNSMFQGIALREQPAKIVFMEKVFHEMLHFKSYNALQITTEENPELNEYRVGLTVHARNGKMMYFVNLNEAVTEEMTKKFAAKLFNDSLFAKEMKQTENIMMRYPHAVTSSGKLLFDKDTFYAEVDGKKSWGKAIGRLSGTQEKTKKITTECFTYRRERRILSTLIDKIIKRNPDKFHSREEVFEIFTKGMMTGNILPVGKLIEKTFGKGALRRIGELDINIKAQENFINSL